MRERTSLEDQISAVKCLEQELEDAITLIELGEAEEDEATIQEGEETIRSLQAEAARRQVETLLSGVRVRDVMSAPVIYVTQETPVQECMTLMTQCRIRYLPVIDGTSLAGIVSIGDLVKVHAEEREVEIRFLHEFISAR